jgi:hypothetical protein
MIFKQPTGGAISHLPIMTPPFSNLLDRYEEVVLSIQVRM